MRRHDDGGGMRRPRAEGNVPSGARAAPGLRSRAIGPAARSWLTAAGLKGLAGSAARRRKDAAMERREAPALPQRSAARHMRKRLAALHPLGFAGGKREAPPRGEKLRRIRRRKEYGRCRAPAVRLPANGERERKTGHDGGADKDNHSGASPKRPAPPRLRSSRRSPAARRTGPCRSPPASRRR